MLHQLSALSISFVLGLAGTSGPAIAASSPQAAPHDPARVAPAFDSALSPQVLRGGTEEAASPGHPSLIAVAAARDAQTVLVRLSTLDAEEVRRLLQNRGIRLQALFSNPPAATAVAGWWNPLDDARKQLLHEFAPELVGNLDGIPVADRDRANRLALDRAIAAAETEQHGLGRGLAFKAVDAQHMLTEIRRALESPPGEARRSLLLLDTAGQGRAAIAIGEVESARFVSLLVPGMFFTVEGQIYDWTVIAQELHRDQLALLDRTDSAAGGAVATIAWIGYHTPHLFTIGSIDQAVEGAHELVRTLDGLRAISGDDPYLALVAHSYGSTAAMIALQEHTGQAGLQDAAVNSLGVDALAMVGSPGGTVASVAELGIDPSAVFVGGASGDPIAHSGFYGPSPVEPAYGARALPVGEGVDALTGADLPGAFGHLDYFLPGSQALRSIALVTLGLSAHPGDLTVASAKPGGLG